jgi:hypothetical protein
LSDAITARGGFTHFDDPASRPRLMDAGVLAFVVAVAASLLLLT